MESYPSKVLSHYYLSYFSIYYCWPLFTSLRYLFYSLIYPKTRNDWSLPGIGKSMIFVYPFSIKLRLSSWSYIPFFFECNDILGGDIFSNLGR